MSHPQGASGRRHPGLPYRCVLEKGGKGGGLSFLQVGAGKSEGGAVRPLVSECGQMVAEGLSSRELVKRDPQGASGRRHFGLPHRWALAGVGGVGWEPFHTTSGRCHGDLSHRELPAGGILVFLTGARWQGGMVPISSAGGLVLPGGTVGFALKRVLAEQVLIFCTDWACHAMPWQSHFRHIQDRHIV